MRRRGAATVSVAVAITSGRAGLCPAHDVTASVYCYAGRDDMRKCAAIGYNAGGVSSQSAHVRWRIAATPGPSPLCGPSFSPYPTAWIGVSRTERQAAAGVVLTASVSFADLGLADSLLRAIADTGYTAPTPIQAQAIPQVLKGGDLLAAAQTGTGKT